MPIKKARLSRKEQARHLVRVEELRAAGLDCELPNELQEKNFHDLDIFVAPAEANILCEYPSGVTAYAIWVRLVAQCTDLRLDDCRIMSPWDFESIVLCQSEKGFYRFRSAFEFTEEVVLNHRIESGLRFHRRGGVFEGWVVATGLKLVPDQYRDRMITKLSLTFADQFGHDHSAHAEAMLQRSAGLRNSDSRVRKSPGSFQTGNLRNQISSDELPQSVLRMQSEGVRVPSINGNDRRTIDGSVPSVPAD